MANKLKNMRLTSVDMVRNGANQEADICLFKSADPADEPTERETNILKRFLNWLRENPTEGENEPTAPVEKANEQPDLADIYKSAITESLQSIAADDNLTATEKNDMIAKSLEEYHEAMVELLSVEKAEEDLSYLLEGLEKSDSEEVEKFNPYHGADGRFTDAGGSASFTYSPGKSKAHDNAIAREQKRQSGAGGDKKEPQTASSGYMKELEDADDLDKLDEIVERAANDDSLTNEEYEALYSKALSMAQSWQPTAKSYSIDEIEEV